MPNDSMERLIGSNKSFCQVQYPSYSSSYHDVRSITRDSHSSVRDIHLPTVYDSAVPLPLSSRSKSYHGDLSRVTPSVFSGLSKCQSDLLRSQRSLHNYSHSTYNNLSNNRNTCSNYSLLSVNAYSKHYNHHNHWSHTPSQQSLPLNSRCRFQKRHVYKTYRSRSANPLINEEYDLSSRKCRSAFLNTTSTQRITSSQNFHIRTKSMCNIHLSPPATTRLNYSIASILPRYSSVRTMFDNSAYSRSILNPDVYVRWLRTKRGMEDVMRRQNYMSTYRFIDPIGIVERRLRNTTSNHVSYPGGFYRSYRTPTFIHRIKGKPI